MQKKEENELMIGKAIGQIIHDIRNPLNTIIGFSSILQIDETINEEIRTYLKKIHHSGLSIEKLLSNIDYFVIENIQEENKEFELNTNVENYIKKQLDLIGEKELLIQPFFENKYNINFSIDVFNKMLDNLFQFSLKGMRSIDKKIIRLYFKKVENELLLYYTDESPPIFIEEDYFSFKEILNSKRGLGILFIEKYVAFAGGKISYKYGNKWQNEIADFKEKIKSNHGFIINMPVF